MPLHYDGDVRIHKIVMGPLHNNGYIISCPSTRKCAIIDAPADIQNLFPELAVENVEFILITHGHKDHIKGYKDIKKHTLKPAGIHESDAHNLLPDIPDFTITDGESLKVGNISIRVIHTPGHTPGGTCFITGDHLFSGDTLFPGGPGATNSRHAFTEILDSITTKLFVLPKETKVYPGHGPDTTIAKAIAEYTIFSSKAHNKDLYGEISWLNS